MNGCKYIRERIDEADKPDLLSHDVTEHIGHCNDCERFAIERTALRSLLAGGTRVSAPINFDAMLNARLAEAKARRSFWWLGSPAYLRLGAATAGLVMLIFAAQYAGLFSGNTDQRATQTAATKPPAQDPNNLERQPQQQPRVLIPAPEVVSNTPRDTPRVFQTSTPRSRRGDLAAGKVLTPGYFTAEDGGVVLVRGRNGDMDVQVPTVSVGAQPLLYVSGGQRAVRSVGTAF